MSDAYETLLDGLDRDEGAQKAPRKARKASAKVEAAATPAASRNTPRGKRANDEYEQVNASVPAELKARAFYYLKMNAAQAKRLPEKQRAELPTNLSDLIEQMLEAWVSKQSKR